MGKFRKNTKKSRNFLTIFPSADMESWMGSGIFLGFVLGLKKVLNYSNEDFLNVVLLPYWYTSLVIHV